MPQTLVSMLDKNAKNRVSFTSIHKKWIQNVAVVEISVKIKFEGNKKN